MIANILPADPHPPHPTPDPEGEVKKSKSTFSEHVHVAYQIKWNNECSNMVANALATDPRPRPLRPKGQNSIFSEHVAFKLKVITNAALL